MLMTVKCDLFLYGDDSCLVFQKKNLQRYVIGLLIIN